MNHVRSLLLAGITLALAACSTGRSPAPDALDDAAVTGDAAVAEDSSTAPDTSSSAFPAVCQRSARECPDMASLDACEMGTGTQGCTHLPLIDCTRDPSAVRLQGSCPSRAQACRLTSGNQGYCTHSCVNDSHCPLPGGGVGTCSSEGPVETCVRP